MGKQVPTRGRAAKSAPPSASARIAALLETTNPDQQADRVGELIQAVRTPPITIVLHFNPLGGTIGVQPIGTNLTYEQVRTLLRRAEEAVSEQERQALVAQVQAEASEGAAADPEAPAPLVEEPALAAVAPSA